MSNWNKLEDLDPPLGVHLWVVDSSFFGREVDIAKASTDACYRIKFAAIMEPFYDINVTHWMLCDYPELPEGCE